MGRSKLRVLVLGAGFGGLEVASILSEERGDQLDLKLIDKNDTFFFGFSKLDLMFWRKPAKSVKFPYYKIRKPGVEFRQENILAIDPQQLRVTTDKGTYNADVLVVALGADYNIEATAGLAEAGNEFYSFQGAERVRQLLPSFKKGNIIVGVCSAPFKCPPAPSEAVLLLDEYLRKQGVRKDCNISLILPFELPLPPSFGTSKAILKAFAERNINYIPEMMVYSIDPGKKIAVLDDGTEMPFDLFLGIPEHAVPKVVEESGLVFDEWIPIDKKSFKTKFPGVYAIGDCTHSGTPKAGIFAEKAGRIAAESIIAEFRGKGAGSHYDGKGFCYVEFGAGMVGRADVDFFSGPSPLGTHHDASRILSDEKDLYFADLKSRWFDL